MTEPCGCEESQELRAANDELRERALRAERGESLVGPTPCWKERTIAAMQKTVATLRKQLNDEAKDHFLMRELNARQMGELRRKLRATRGEFDECAIEGCPGQALPSDDCCFSHWAEETDPELFARREAKRAEERRRRHALCEQMALNAVPIVSPGGRPVIRDGEHMTKAKETSE